MLKPNQLEIQLVRKDDLDIKKEIKKTDKVESKIKKYQVQGSFALA